MTCAEHQRTINRFTDHEVKAAECAELFGHLGTCAECRQFYDTMLTLAAELDNVHLAIDEVQASARLQGSESIRQPGYGVVGQTRIAPRSSSVVLAAVALLVITLLFSINVTIEKPTPTSPSTLTSQR